MKFKTSGKLPIVVEESVEYSLCYSPPSMNVTPISVNPLYMLTFFYSPHIAHYKCYTC